MKFKGLRPGIRVAIYTVSGELVAEPDVVGDTALWNGETKDGRPASMGTYVYVVEWGKVVVKRGKIVVVR